MALKGTPRAPNAGRKKGTPNKNSLPLMEKAQKLGVDPFEVLLMFCKGDWDGLGYFSSTITKFGKGGETYEVDTVTADQRLKAAAEACKYLYPTLKSTEGTVKVVTNDRPLKYLTDEELDAL